PACFRTSRALRKTSRLCADFMSNSGRCTPIFLPRTRPGSARNLKTCVPEVASLGSCPAIASSTSPTSVAERASGPILSRLQASVIQPYRLTRPYVGRTPHTPQEADGLTIEPPVSEPIENTTMPAAVAPPGPEDDPEVVRSSFQGFRASSSSLDFCPPPA